MFYSKHVEVKRHFVYFPEIKKTFALYSLVSNLLASQKGEFFLLCPVFGTLDENDAGHYNEQVRRFKRNSNDNIELLQQQLYVIMSTLCALNKTADVQHNDKVVRKGLSDILTYLDTLSSQTARKLDICRPSLLYRNTLLKLTMLLRSSRGI